MKTTTKTVRTLNDSTLLRAANEVRGYLANPHLDTDIASEYRSTLDKLESEIRRREI